MTNLQKILNGNGKELRGYSVISKEIADLFCLNLWLENRLILLMVLKDNPYIVLALNSPKPGVVTKEFRELLKKIRKTKIDLNDFNGIVKEFRKKFRVKKYSELEERLLLVRKDRDIACHGMLMEFVGEGHHLILFYKEDGRQKAKDYRRWRRLKKKYGMSPKNIKYRPQKIGNERHGFAGISIDHSEESRRRVTGDFEYFTENIIPNYLLSVGLERHVAAGFVFGKVL